MNEKSLNHLSDCVVYENKRKQIREIATVDELVYRTGDIETPLCSRCKHHRNCPFYSKPSACAILSDLLETDERDPKIIANLAPVLLTKLINSMLQSLNMSQKLKQLQLAILYLLRLENTEEQQVYGVDVEVKELDNIRTQRIERLGLPIAKTKKHSRTRVFKRNRKG